ncbi:MAG: transglutaminase domain-containing protein [Candidatus Bathyarchaeia archaeon]
MSFLLFADLWTGQSSNSINQDGNGWNPFHDPKPLLTVDIQEGYTYWYRSISTDLPEYSTSLTIVVKNIGDASADNVAVSVSSDGLTLSYDTVPLLQSNEQYANQISVTLTYDSVKSVVANAACSSDSKSTSLSIQAKLPRHIDEDIAKLYITPQESTVVNLKNQILKDKFILTPNWMALRDWVANNIEYRYDSNVYGDEYWQLPKETVQKRTGDCEDFSILLCSLLRADGWDVNSVYVMVGEQNGSYHAWVQIIWAGIHYGIEPQADGWSTAIGDFLTLSGYAAEDKFNDASYRITG